MGVEAAAPMQTPMPTPIRVAQQEGKRAWQSRAERGIAWHGMADLDFCCCLSLSIFFMPNASAHYPPALTRLLTTFCTPFAAQHSTAQHSTSRLSKSRGHSSQPGTQHAAQLTVA
ncbi:hypothetical protein JHW43_000132 [Diplocarpon mali]|nr:hypothetical protein JHW43_000132 [Diplocarpon mali]